MLIRMTIVAQNPRTTTIEQPFYVRTAWAFWERRAPKPRRLSHMKWEMKYVSAKEQVLITNGGPISMDEARKQTEKTICLLREKKATRVLIDWSEAEQGPSTAEIWSLVECYHRLGAPDQTRIAIVQCKTVEGISPFAFYQFGACNRGYHANLFDSTETAEA